MPLDPISVSDLLDPRKSVVTQVHEVDLVPIATSYGAIIVLVFTFHHPESGLQWKQACPLTRDALSSLAQVMEHVKSIRLIDDQPPY